MFAFISAVLSVATEILKNYWKPLAIILILICTFEAGVKSTEQKFEAQINKDKADQALALVAAEEASKKKQDEFDTAKDKIVTDFETYKNTHPKIIEVTKYVTAKDDANCIIPTGFVRLHNDSIDAKSSDSSKTESISSSTDSPSGIKLSQVGRTVSDNYNICQTEMKKLEELQKTVILFQAKQGDE